MKTPVLHPARPAPARFRRGLLRGGLGLLVLLAAGCRRPGPPAYQGYLEAEFLYVAAPLAGRLERLAVTRGQEVHVGDLLFELERTAEAAAVDEATRRLAQAQARLDNLRKGRRPSEIAALEAQLARAEANRRWAETELARRQQLRAQEVISAAELDLARARRDADAALVESLRAELETARLGAREDEIRAAEAEVAALTAALTRARWALDQKRQTAPAAGRVHDTLFREGELVAAGQPVVVLFPPTHLKARFFVPETEVAGISPGATVWLHADGWPAPVSATVTYVATRPEYTPPVIYSRENRAKLVFMLEAKPDPARAAALHPGQPVEVRTTP